MTVIQYDFVIFCIGIEEVDHDRSFEFIAGNNGAQHFQCGLVSTVGFFMLMNDFREFTFESPEMEKWSPIDFSDQVLQVHIFSQQIVFPETGRQPVAFPVKDRSQGLSFCIGKQTVLFVIILPAYFFLFCFHLCEVGRPVG